MLVTVLTLYNASEMYVVRGRLEAEGIACFLKDELTVQVSQYSNAFGGIKLQVYKDDSEQAIEILKEFGYLKDEESGNLNQLLSQINSSSLKIPFINRLSFFQRFITLVVLLILVFGSLLYFMLKPSDIELLTSHSWCVDKVFYNGKLIGPKTTGFRVAVEIYGSENCDERMDLEKGHKLFLPGVGTTSTMGSWKFDENNMIVFDADTLKNIYSSRYNMDISFNELILKSNTTVIYAHKAPF